MMHNFHISDENNKKAMRLFHRVEKIGFMVDNGCGVHLTISAAALVVSYLVTWYTPFKLFEGHWFLQLFVCLCIGGFFTSLYNAFLNEKGTYRKLCKALKCSVFVKDMKLNEKEDSSELDGVIIPDLTVTYDVDIPEGQVAVLIKVSEKKNKVIAFLDNSSVGRNKKLEVASEQLKDALKEARVGDDLVVLQVCQVNNCEDGYVKDEDIDTRLITQEGFYKFYSHED